MKILFGVFVAGGLALWVARDSYRLLDQTLALDVLGLTLLAGASVLALGAKHSDANDSDSYFPKLRYLIVALLPWLFFMTLFLNVFLDRSSPMQYPTTVVSKSKGILGQSITVTSWRPGRSAESIPVDAYVYPSLPASGPIIVSVKPGLLGIPWVSGFEGRYRLNLRTHQLLPTILAARKLNERDKTPWAINCAIVDAISKAEQILEKIDERWPD